MKKKHTFGLCVRGVLATFVTVRRSRNVTKPVEDMTSSCSLTYLVLYRLPTNFTMYRTKSKPKRPATLLTFLFVALLKDAFSGLKSFSPDSSFSSSLLICVCGQGG